MHWIKDNVQNKKRELIIRLFLLTLSLLFCLLVFEIYLRLTIKNEAEFDYSFTYNPELNTIYYQRSFLHDYSTTEAWERGAYNSYLGWDQKEGQIRGQQTYSYTPKEDIFRIVALGDSFTFGDEVEDNETYPFYLETLIDKSEVLNMAVGGYGIDQMVLKYLKYGREYKPDLILLGIHPPDYVRTSVSFFGFTKPTFYYNYETNSMGLTNTNIPPPEEVFNDLKQKIHGYKLYSFAYLRNRLLRAYWKFITPEIKEKYYQDTDRIIEHILSKLIESTKNTDTKLLIVQIPLGNHFKDEKTLAKAKEEKIHTHLLKIYQKLNIVHIDLLEEFMANFSKEKIFNDFYFYRTESVRGHFTKEGNLEVAKIIIDKLKDF